MAGATRTLRLVSAFRVAVVPAGTEGRDIPAAQKRLRLTQYLSVSARTDSYPTGQELTGNSLVSYPATQFNRQSKDGFKRQARIPPSFGSPSSSGSFQNPRASRWW